MRIKVLKPVEIEVTAIRCVIPDADRDAESDDQIAAFRLLPGWNGGDLDVVLDLDTRKVRDWPEGQTGDLYVKVVDAGSYDLLGGVNVRERAMDGGWTASQVEGQLATRSECYVPGCVPGEFGDYFALKVGPDGSIADWDPKPGQIAATFFPLGQVSRG